MNYPVVIEKEEGTDFGVEVPDLPGCVSAGATIEEALAAVTEAIELHLECMIADGEAVPDPKPVAEHQRDKHFRRRGLVWAMVNIDRSKLRTEAKRINITLPQRLLDRADAHATKIGETRSGLIAKALDQLVRA